MDRHPFTRSRLIPLALAVALFFFSAACIFSGHVYTSAGPGATPEPLPGAQVRVYADAGPQPGAYLGRCRTDSSGAYSFTLVDPRIPISPSGLFRLINLLAAFPGPLPGFPGGPPTGSFDLVVAPPPGYTAAGTRAGTSAEGAGEDTIRVSPLDNGEYEGNDFFLEERP